MNDLFGLSMDLIAGVCLAVTLAILGFVALIAWRNPVMFKLGLRNIPRRKAQTSLIVIGLMLSTLIMSAAFGTGDTLTTSVTSEVYTTLGEADEWVSWDAQKQPAPLEQQVIPLATVEAWQRQFADDPDIEAIAPFQRETLPVQDARTRLNHPTARIAAFREQDAAGLGGLRDLEGNPVTLEGNEIAVNKDLAEEIDAVIGDTLVVYYQGGPVEFTVTAIVPSSVLSGAIDANARHGAAVAFPTLAALTGRGQNADAVVISNTGGVKDGLGASDRVVDKFEPLLEGTPYEIQPLKKDFIRFAELIGASFTTIFVVFGLFSIAAGVLLIFLIFIMLAAERKPEMGMARAVGAKRRQVVESFLAEGMGYDLGSAVVGLVAGMGVTVLMIAVINAFAGDDLGFDIAASFTVRSLTVAFCLGVIATFLVIFIASWRASRLNITAAIRDLPDSPPLDPEAATWPGYFRAAINGIAALALPIGLAFPFFGVPGILLGAPMLLVGLVSPWFYLLRGSNVAAPAALRTSEGPPRWPWIAGLAVPVVGWFLVLPWYFVALLLVRITRDRRPAAIPRPLRVAALFIWPLSFVVALLQPWRVRVSWSAACGVALGITGVALIYGGLDTNTAFLFLMGVSFIFLWVAVTLRYFGIADRLSFTATSALLLIVWYLPSDVTKPLVGELNGNIEMFFLSGLVMVTCGVLIVVYNADVVLPAIARLGSRFSRVVPALKTGVAYPLTSRVRTGMTMTMIGLIIFSLVMMSTMNKNFSALFLNDDTRGGFDVVVRVNENNPVDDLGATLTAAGVATDGITATGEFRLALPAEVQVENRDGYRNTEDDEVTPYSRIKLFGADAGLLDAQKIPLKKRAAGYDSDEAVWAALAADPTLALVPASVTATPDPFAPGGDRLLRLDELSGGFDPFTLQLRNAASGEDATITVIGQLKEAGDTFLGLGSPDFATGIVTGKEVVTSLFPQARGQVYYLSTAPGVDVEEYAKEIEAALTQASADSLQQLLDDQQRLQTGFLLVFQGFVGLGLLVGIAALGVIASRAVVERRQQIGMLRAIGYQRGMVALSFLFESGFIALSGIVLGLTLGLSLAWVLVFSGDLGTEAEGIDFTVPWLELLVICGVAFIASMLMTFLPARAASRVPVAEALRYE